MRQTNKKEKEKEKAAHVRHMKQNWKIWKISTAVIF